MEGDEQFFVRILTAEGVGVPIDVVSGLATITIADDDDSADGGVGGQLADACRPVTVDLPDYAPVRPWQRRLSAAGLPAFDLPVVTDHLDQVLALDEELATIGNPLAGLSGDVGWIRHDRVGRRSIDFVQGGIGGRPAGQTGNDVIQVRCVVSLLGLAQAAGFTGDTYDDATADVLAQLASALGLDGSLAPHGDLTVTLVVGVDDQGPYGVDPDRGRTRARRHRAPRRARPT